MAFDVTSLRAQFPALESGIAFFDGPGGTQTPRVVGEAIASTLTGPLSNMGTVAASQRNAMQAIADFRQAYADFLGADSRGIVHGRSATQLTYDMSRSLAKNWGPGDEVVVSQLDHDGNVRPWVQAAERAGATIRWIEFDPETSEVDWASVERAITDRTRVVAVTAASNLLGTMPPVRAISDLAHSVGALAWVDGVHYSAHAFVDVEALGADFYVCSPYKFHGPHCAVLAASPDLLETIWPDKLLPSTNDVPERFEFGTLPYETLAGATTAVDFLASIDPGEGTTRRDRLAKSLHSVDMHELNLRMEIEADLAELPGATLHSRAENRTPTLLVTFDGKSANDAYHFLGERNVLAPAGSFYAHEAAQRLALSDPQPMRIGLACYINDDDVRRLREGLAAFLAL